MPTFPQSLNPEKLMKTIPLTTSDNAEIQLPAMPQRFNIADLSGKLIYTNLVRASWFQGYDWNDNYGHICDSLIRINKWKVIPI